MTRSLCTQYLYLYCMKTPLQLSLRMPIYRVPYDQLIAKEKKNCLQMVLQHRLESFKVCLWFFSSLPAGTVHGEGSAIQQNCEGYMFVTLCSRRTGCKYGLTIIQEQWAIVWPDDQGIRKKLFLKIDSIEVWGKGKSINFSKETQSERIFVWHVSLGRSSQVNE